MKVLKILENAFADTSFSNTDICSLPQIWAWKRFVALLNEKNLEKKKF